MQRRGRGLLAIVAALAAGLAVCSFQVAAQLHAEVTSQHPRIYVAPLPDIFNYRCACIKVNTHSIPMSIHHVPAWVEPMQVGWPTYASC